MDYSSFNLLKLKYVVKQSWYIWKLSKTEALIGIVGKLQKIKWENAMTIDRHSWGFRREANLKDYLKIEELITQLASTVR